ncbi:MAG TPA: hypothetical protein P5081_07905 [Phycisphaerae bacterium]|nr:hypothetical protein [Phycisphaerae bacterium]HRW52796.1 hypothetical protein [Phycisphaerae bacterium]
MTSGDQTSVTNELCGVVPDSYPPIYLAPEPRRHVSFARALALNSFGSHYAPHLAAGSTWRALAAYAICVLLGFLFIVAVWVMALRRMDVFEADSVRKCVARMGMYLMVAIDRLPIHPLLTMAILFLLPGVSAIVFAAGVELFSHTATGDGAASKCRRWFNSALWSATALPWVGLLFFVSTMIYAATEPWSGFEGANTPFGDLAHSATFWLALYALGVAWMATLTCEGGQTYVGPAVGPGYAPRRPTCRGCGYALNGLRCYDRCPECGLDIKGSLPVVAYADDSTAPELVDVEYEEDTVPVETRAEQVTTEGAV